MSEHSKHYDDTERNKSLAMAGGQVVASDLHDAIMNLPCDRTMSHFVSRDDFKLYKEGHRDARHAAAELAIQCRPTATNVIRNTKLDGVAGVERDAVPAREWTAGGLLTMSDSDYPGMGQCFGQVWQGDDLIARVYGDSHEEVRNRVARVVAATPSQEAKPAVQAPADIAEALCNVLEQFTQLSTDAIDERVPMMVALAAPSQQPAASPTEAK